MNVMRGIIDAKYKKAESKEKNCAAIEATKSADIAKQMILGKATV